ncbi:MAG: VWA domain-containing protein [Gammaproteobacteria bacterium]|nr:VWA domain-containing protein [Gammaproteobacteria bacterium]
MIQFAQPWALLALLSIPAILVLHALRPRRRRVVLSTTSIWRAALREQQRGLGLQKLLKDLSLVLLLLLALLVSIGLADPRWSTQASEGSDTVLVLDVSASLQTRSDALSTRSRFADLKQQAASIIDTLAADSRLLIMTSGRAPQLRTGFESDREHLHRQLDALQATDESGRPRAALELALSLIRNRERGLVYFLTDGAFDEDVDFGTPQIEYRVFGKPGRNVAITRFDVRPEVGTEDRFEVLLTLRNFTDERLIVPATVTLAANRGLEQRVELAPGEKKTVVLPVQGSLTGPAQANIDLDDDLRADDRAFAVVGADERLHVLLYSEGNFYLESVLAAMPNVTVTRLDSLQMDVYQHELRGHDIVVFDRITPPRLDTGRFLLIDALAPDLPFHADGSVVRPTIVGRGVNTLVRQLDLSDVRIDKAQRIVLEQRTPGLQRLFWSTDTVLALALLQQEARLVFVGFNLIDSNFPLQTAFPLFLHESLNWLRPRETRHASTQSPAGESLLISLPAEQLDLVVRTPSGDGMIYPVEQGRVLFDATSQAGIYRYERALTQRYFAVNLTDERESDIRPRARIPAAADVAAPRGRGSRAAIALWPYLMSVALVVLLLEWGVWCWRPRRA